MWIPIYWAAVIFSVLLVFTLYSYIPVKTRMGNSASRTLAHDVVELFREMWQLFFDGCSCWTSLWQQHNLISSFSGLSPWLSLCAAPALVITITVIFLMELFYSLTSFPIPSHQIGTQTPLRAQLCMPCKGRNKWLGLKRWLLKLL